MFGYTTELRSMSTGRASSAMEPLKYSKSFAREERDSGSFDNAAYTLEGMNPATQASPGFLFACYRNFFPRAIRNRT